MCVLSMLEESPCTGEHTLTHLAGENGGLFCFGKEEREIKLITQTPKLRLLNTYQSKPMLGKVTFKSNGLQYCVTP